ncbi:peptide deformylase [Falsigemmobacter faecalis]|uniref:Peptide deformylase n=1 Tax=Falsigemmobacter faecalis TaxID=2488730 RepID=A0A3P3DFP1_9RHOB|nr:peptide deformylase [Falsigemmobacter faecalis]RRH72486.1 peptide deformylase [Falsigemmobacter faecalis]
MAILNILQFPDPRLRRICLPVPEISDEIRRLAADMLETMYDAPGRGLAGPQVGALLRIFVMDVTWREGEARPFVCINPEILAFSDETAVFTEGCLSIPEVPGEVTRPAEIVLAWTDLNGQRQQKRMSGLEAVCAQHEFDHLNGRLCIDLMSEPARFAASPRLQAMTL